MLRWLLPGLFLLLSAPVYGACSGSSPNWTVTAATDAAIRECVTSGGNASLADGDTVTLNFSGTASITSTLSITKAITIIGQTCSTSGSSGNSTGRATSCTTKMSYDFSSGVLLDVTLVSAKTTRVSNIEFVKTTGTNIALNLIGTDAVSQTDGRRFRVDHSRFIRMPTFTIRPSDAWGLIDHNYFDLAEIGIYPYDAGGYNFSDGRWAAITAFGSAASTTNDWVFIEQNYVEATTRSSPNAPPPLTDGFAGSKIVVRFNDLKDCINIENHGTEGGGRARGGRGIETYLNTGTCDGTSSTTVYVRSGANLNWGNQWNGYSGLYAATLLNYRTIGYHPFGMADGTSAWDVNDAGNPQTITNGGASCTSTVCTATALSTIDRNAQTITVTVSTATWSNNQWAGYNLRKQGCIALNENNPCGLLITSNTGTTITAAYLNPNIFLHFGVGDTFSLNKIPYLMDAPCRDQGTQLPTARATSSIVRGGGGNLTATVTLSSHGFSTNDYVDISEDSNGASTSAWSGATTYAINDFVTYSGVTYEAVQAGTNHQPDVSGTYWYATGRSSAYRGSWQITVTGANTFTFTIGWDPGYDSAFAYVTKKPTAFNDQVSDSCFQWLNTNSATNTLFSVDNYGLSIRPVDSYYDYGGTVQSSSTSPFNGTVTNTSLGIGVGTAARRPPICTTGVAYWALDEGLWNSSGLTYSVGGNSYANGRLYKCTSTDTWTLYYTPYDFPHAAPASCTPDHLTFSAQPGSVAVNVALGTVTVGIYDSGNNLCPSATDTITIANKGGTCIGMNLGGTKSGAASGSFTTTNLTEDVAGVCILSATASGLTGADSSAFTISAAGTGGGIGARLRLRIQ